MKKPGWSSRSWIPPAARFAFGRTRLSDPAILPRIGPDEPITPNLEEIAHGIVDAATRRDYEAVLAGFAPDAAWDMSRFGIGLFNGHEALRGFFEDWAGSFDDFEVGFEEFDDLGNGVTFGVLFQRGRPRGASGFVELPYATVVIWADRLIAQITSYSGVDADRARAVAQQLAGERG